MVVAETDKNGKEQASFTRGDNAELLSMEQNGETWYYLCDGHGSVRILTNEAGRITDRYSYDAYGNILEKEGDTDNDFLYTGEQYNANTGLYYLRARYMNPSTGTFISMDSYQGSIYDPVTLHKSLYANANPVMYTDPSGYMTDNLVSAEGNLILASGWIQSESTYFMIGMNAIRKLWAIRVVRAVSYLSTSVLLSLVIDDFLNQRYTTDAYDVAVEILEYALENIEVICNKAEVASETISERLRLAVHEAEDKGKEDDRKKNRKNGKKNGKKGGKNDRERDINELGDANLNDLDKLPDNKIQEMGGEEYTQGTKRSSGKSKSDLYWDKKGNIYSVPKKGGPPQWVGWLPRNLN